MSLLADVRSAYCACDASEGDHGQFCIETLKPRIVAVLEAAERLTLACGEGSVYGTVESEALATALKDAGQPQPIIEHCYFDRAGTALCPYCCGPYHGRWPTRADCQRAYAQTVGG